MRSVRRGELDKTSRNTGFILRAYLNDVNMKMNIKLIIVILLFPLFLAGQNKSDQIEEIIQDYVSPHGPGLALMITQNHKVLYENAFGLSNISTDEKIQTDHLFRVGSITKQFTAAAILKLAYEERLNLEDPIDKYLSNIAEEKRISIKQLLQHSSGLGNQSDVLELNSDSIDLNNYPRDMIQPILNSPRKFTPGTDYAYSNLGYIVLGYIIERVSGMSYESYLKKSFFEPLAMNSTGFEYLSEDIAPESAGYSMVNGKYEEAAPIKMKIAYAAGALVSNLYDLEKWNGAIMKGEILPQAYVSQIQETSVLPDEKPTGYSFGWQIGNIQGLKTVKHDGIVNGFTSMTIYIPEADLFVTTLSNCDCFRDIELPASKIAALFIERPFSSQTIELPKSEIEKFQGKYSGDGTEMIIAAHDSILMYYRSGGDKRKLIPVGVKTFQIEGGLDQIMFHFEENDSSYTLRSLADSSRWRKTENVEAYNSILLDQLQLEEYVGKYQVPNAFVFEVIRIGNKLFGQIGNDRKEIFCYDYDKFCARNTDALLKFSRDPEGKITKLTLNLGREITAERILE